MLAAVILRVLPRWRRARAASSPRATPAAAERTPTGIAVPPHHVPGRRDRALLRRLRRLPRLHVTTGQRPHGRQARARGRGERRHDHVRCAPTTSGTPATCSSSPATTAGSTGTSTSTTTRPAPTTARTPRSGGFAPGIKRRQQGEGGPVHRVHGRQRRRRDDTQPHLHFEMHTPDDTFDRSVHVVAARAGRCPRTGCAAARRTRRRIRRRRAARATGRSARDGDGARVRSACKRIGSARRDRRDRTPYVAIAPTATGKGYWIVDARGDVRRVRRRAARTAHGAARTSTRRSSA